jgi:hypothetical protein
MKSRVQENMAEVSRVDFHKVIHINRMKPRVQEDMAEALPRGLLLGYSYSSHEDHGPG